MSENGSGNGVSVLGGALDLRELFPSEWMRTHTEYERIDAFIADGDGIPATRESERRPAWNEHVASTSEFDDWKEMLGEALDDYQRRRTATTRG